MVKWPPARGWKGHFESPESPGIYLHILYIATEKIDWQHDIPAPPNYPVENYHHQK